MTVANTIEAKLRRAFAPRELRVIDESELHAGHGGARPDGETHFRVEITASAFEGQSRIERHRMIYAELERELAGPVHALALVAKAPSE